MIPLRDDIPSERIPLLNYLLIVSNVAVFFHELSLGDRINEFVLKWGLVPWQMTQGVTTNGFSLETHVAPWFTSMFIHGGWLHLLGNMWFLYIFGDNVEDRLGRLRYFVLFLSGGLLAGLAQMISAPESSVPIVGASGAVSAALGAYFVLYPRAKVLTLVPIFIILYTIRLPAFLFIGVWFAIQILFGYASTAPGGQEGSVAWWAHVGGFAAGVFLALLLKSGTTQRAPVPMACGRVRFRRKG